MVKKTRLIIGITAILIGIISFVLLYSALSQANTQKYQSTVIATLVLTMEAR